jgi:hypothetical protein
MSTTAQIEANRLNAQSSTGPTSAEGKARSSLNALSHGFYSKHLLLPDEDPAELELLRSSLIDSYQPEDGAELQLVERVIACEWKLHRLEKMEAVTVQRGSEGLADLERLSRMSQRLDNMLHKAIKALRELRKEKRQQEQSQTSEADVWNEPNSSSKSAAGKSLRLHQPERGNFMDGLGEQLSRDLPHFAASAIAGKGNKPPRHAAGTR